MTTHADAVKSFTKALYASDLKESLPPRKDFYKFMKSFLSDTNTDDELDKLKTEYEEATGKRPKGPKANDKDWLKNKISESSSESESDTELLALKEEYFAELGKKPSGRKANSADWLKAKIAEAKKPKSEVQILKEEYTEKLGKKPSGPKANNAEWLKTKISEFESRSQDEIELTEMKAKYEEVLGKKPKGPKTNDIDWLKGKIDEFLKEDESSEDEAKDSSEEEIEESSEEDNDEKQQEKEDEVNDGEETEELSDEEDDSDSARGTGLKPLKLELKSVDFTFEGVAYKRTFDKEKDTWMVENEDGNEVGEWMDDKTGGWIIWEEDCWEEIHQEHEDYTGEA